MSMDKEERNWCFFWNSPHLYIDQTWLSALSLEILTRTKSRLVKQSCYPYLCEVLALDREIQQPKYPLWKSALWAITQNPKRSTTMAGVAYAPERFNDLEKSDNAPLNLEDYQSASQLGIALALKSRFTVPASATTYHLRGIWLLNQALALDFPAAWPRTRLAFERQNVEPNLSVSDFDNDINTATLRRLWLAIAYKLSNS